MATAKEALDKIKEAEVKALRIVEEAKRTAHKIFEEARMEKGRILKFAEENALIDARRLEKKVEEETFKEISVINAEARSDCEALKAKAKQNIGKAAEFVKAKVNL